MVRARLVVLLACLGWLAAGCADAQHPGEESASSDDAPRHTSHRHKKKKKAVADDDTGDAPKKHAKSTDDDDDDSDAARKKTKKHADDDSDDDTPKKHVKKKVAKKHAGDDDDDDDDAAAAKKRAAVKKAAAAKEAADEKAAAKKEAQEKAAEEKVEKQKAAEEKAAEDKAARKKAANDRAAAKKEAAEEKAAAKKEALEKEAEKEAEKKAAKKKAAEDDTPKVSDDDDDEDDKPKSKAKLAVKPKAKSSDDDDDETKPKSKSIAAKTKPKSDDDDAKPTPKVVAHEDDKPEPPKKQRSIEEDVAVDDPLATKPPVRTASETADESEEATTSDTAAVAVVAAPAGATLQDRALTTPQGQIDLHAGLPINVLSVTNAMGMSTSSTSEGLALGLAYGFNAKTEVGFDYTLGLSPGAIKGPITLHGAYSLGHGKLDFAGAAALAIDFVDSVNPTTMTTTTDTAASLELGAWVRYHATPTVTIFSGLPATPNASAGVSKLAFPLPVLPYQLQIGLSSGAPIALTLPIGLGYQASPKLYTFASLDLANIRIANTSNAFLFKDFIPIAIGGFYQFDTLSVGATFADDLKQGFGYLRFELIARYLLH